MASKRALERQLSRLASFSEPAVELEQYPTPARLAATIVHLADLQGDLDRRVVDLGSGAGVLGLAAAIRGAPRVVGIERDRAAIETALANETDLHPPIRVDWVCGDATRPPIAAGDTTVVMNPPFGAQRGREHADRAFLVAAADIATVSYSVHNAESWEFVEAFSVDNGGSVTHAYQAQLELDRQFPFHDADEIELPVEVFRIEWT